MLDFYAIAAVRDQSMLDIHMGCKRSEFVIMISKISYI